MRLLVNKKLGEKIKKFRLLKGLTQEKLAEQCECSTSHITKIETGKVNPSTNTLIKISNVLGTTYDQLLFGEYKNVDDIYAREISNKLSGYSDRKKRIIYDLIMEVFVTFDRFDE